MLTDFIQAAFAMCMRYLLHHIYLYTNMHGATSKRTKLFIMAAIFFCGATAQRGP